MAGVGEGASPCDKLLETLILQAVASLSECNVSAESTKVCASSMPLSPTSKQLVKVPPLEPLQDTLWPQKASKRKAGVHKKGSKYVINQMALAETMYKMQDYVPRNEHEQLRQQVVALQRKLHERDFEVSTLQGVLALMLQARSRQQTQPPVVPHL